MSQTKAQFHLKELEDHVDAIRHREGVKVGSKIEADLDWINFHARQLVSSCAECGETKNDTGEGSKNP